jgi:hypothetical protein
MCIKCAKAEKKKSAVVAKAAAEAKKKDAAEKAAGGCGLLRYIIPSCMYTITDKEGVQHGIGVNHDVSTADEQGGGGKDEACCTSEMSADINEFYLFHGTSLQKAEVICKNGFDPAAASSYCLYGAGSYFAINSCKSHQYSSAKGKSSDLVMLVCRVAMGSPHCTAKSHKNERRPPENYDSIFARHGIANGRQQHHNEYVVFDRHQVYPEYIVRYKV